MHSSPRSHSGKKDPRPAMHAVLLRRLVSLATQQQHTYTHTTHIHSIDTHTHTAHAHTTHTHTPRTHTHTTHTYSHIQTQRQTLTADRRSCQSAVGDLRGRLRRHARDRSHLTAGAGQPPQDGLSTNKMALITSDCGAILLPDHQMALITSDYVPFRKPCRLKTGCPGPGRASHDLQLQSLWRIHTAAVG